MESIKVITEEAIFIMRTNDGDFAAYTTSKPNIFVKAPSLPELETELRAVLESGKWKSKHKIAVTIDYKNLLNKYAYLNDT